MTAVPPGTKVASARGWYANQPKDAAPIGVNSPTAIMTAPVATITPAPTQVSITRLSLPATLRHYPRRDVSYLQNPRLRDIHCAAGVDPETVVDSLDAIAKVTSVSKTTTVRTASRHQGGRVV